MTRIRRVFLVLMLSLLLPMPLAAQEEVRESDTADTWTVNLKDADIRALVDQVSDITGYSFVVDPRVKGKVTVVSETPMTSGEV